MTTNKETEFSCVDCHVQKCEKRPDRSGSREGFPQFCVTPEICGKQKEELLKIYSEAKNAQIMKAAAEVEFEGYGQLTRVQEIMEFARKIGARKIGIATCVGLIRESQIFAEVLRKHDFEVYGMACKVGQIPKTEVGIPAECEAVGVTMCNPILQARKLNEAGTELNVVVGLCVGHDSLFYKYAEAPTTTLVTKDRVLGHNPAAALYTAKTYYSKLLDKSAHNEI